MSQLPLAEIISLLLLLFVAGGGGETEQRTWLAAGQTGQMQALGQSIMVGGVAYWLAEFVA